MNKVIPIVFSVNKNFKYPLLVAIQSLKDSRKRDYVLDIYVFHSELEEEDIEIFNELIDYNTKITAVSINKYLANTNFYDVYKYSLAMYYRFFIPEILTQYDKVLYLDTDIAVKGDVINFFHIDFQDELIAAVKEKEDNDYINSGVILFNIKECQKESFCFKCIKYIADNRTLNLPDQDAINEVCKGKIKYLDYRYNFQMQNCFAKAFDNFNVTEKYAYIDSLREHNILENQILIIHYTWYVKPWVFKHLRLANVWWDSAKKLSKSTQRSLKEFCQLSSKDYLSDDEVKLIYKRSSNKINLLFFKIKKFFSRIKNKRIKK